MNSSQSAPARNPSANANHAHRPADAAEVELDLRDDLRAGREPFNRIMTAVAALEPAQVLHLRAIFEPVPLFHVLGEQGFAWESHAHASDDWSVWFWRPDASASRRLPEPGVDMSSNTVELDVRVLPPRDKHPTIFRTFDSLAVGDAMVIVNDHDPKPLRYQLAAERPDRFEWVYEAEGPEVWRVRIARR